MYGIVVVSSADIPRMSGRCSSSASRYFSTGLLIPMSMTSKPAPSSIIPTRFLPMSWMSPLTVPITILPIDSAPVSASSGRRIAMPPFIEFAAISTSGTNRIPSRKSTPTMRMPSTSASSSTREGVQPRPSSRCVPSSISSFMPLYRSSCICSTSSSSGSSDRTISSSSDGASSDMAIVLLGSLRAPHSFPILGPEGGSTRRAMARARRSGCPERHVGARPRRCHRPAGPACVPGHGTGGRAGPRTRARADQAAPLGLAERNRLATSTSRNAPNRARSR